MNCPQLPPNYLPNNVFDIPQNMLNLNPNEYYSLSTVHSVPHGQVGNQHMLTNVVPVLAQNLYNSEQYNNGNLPFIWGGGLFQF